MPLFVDTATHRVCRSFLKPGAGDGRQTPFATGTPRVTSTFSAEGQQKGPQVCLGTPKTQLSSQLVPMMFNGTLR